MKNKKNMIENNISCRSRFTCYGKKGISAIVATVLIILITVAAVTIIWAAIIPMISNQLGGATECFDASASLRVLSDYSCYNDTAGSEYVDVQVSRSTGDFELVGIDISGNYKGSSDTVKITTNLPDPNGAKVYRIGLSGEDGTDGNFTFEGIDGASVAARVKSGQTDILCDGSIVTQIGPCS